MLEQVFTGTTYSKKDTGDLYYVLYLGTHSEPLNEPMVIYKRYEGEDNTVWVISYVSFLEEFEKKS